MNITKALRKDFTREVKNNIGRFLSIFFIVLLGVAFFAGLKASSPDMQYSMDKYFDEYRIMDIQVMSTLGMTADDMVALSEIEGVEQVQASKFVDAVAYMDTSEVVYRVNGLQKGYKNDPESYINQLKIVEGRLPENPGEVVLESSNLAYSSYEVGDYITFYSSSTNELMGENFATDTFLVVGLAETPYYLSYTKGPSTLSGGTVDYFAYILDSDFLFDYYTEALITVDGARELEMYSDEYAECVATVMDRITAISDERCTVRANGVRTEIETELADAERQYNDGLETFSIEIAKAEQTLSDAYDQLIQGEMELEAGQKSFEEQYGEGVAQIDANESTITGMQNKYGPMLDSTNTMMENVDTLVDSANNAKTGYDTNASEARTELNEIQELIDSGTLDDDTLAQYQDLQSRYTELLDGYDQLSSGFGQILDASDKFITGITDSIKDIKNTVSDAKEMLQNAKEQLVDSKTLAEQQFIEAEQEIAEGWVSYNEGIEELERQKAEGQLQLDDAKEQLVTAKEMVNKINNPEWIILDRNSNYGYVDYSLTCERIEKIAAVFPVFFYLVAALVCSTTMTRMIDEQRGIIGTYKALGYNNFSISFKYVAYAGIASASGGIIGVILGVIFFPYTVYYAWSAMYVLPPVSFKIQYVLMIVSVLIGVVVSCMTAFITCRKSLSETPSMMMRPKAPKEGKKILIERIRFIWRALSFSQKVTVRNIFRYKKRFWMTVIGITGCAALLLAGFGLSNSVHTIVSRQFNEIFRYDIDIAYSSVATEEECKEIVDLLNGEDVVESFSQVAMYNASTTTEADTQSYTLVIPSKENVSEFNSYVCLRDRESEAEFSLPDNGIVLTELLAKNLGVKPGDVIKIENGKGFTREVEVKAIAENYLFHYAYMNPDEYERIFELAPDNNGLIIKLVSDNTDLLDAISSKFLHYDQIGSVTLYSSYADQMSDSINSLNMVVYIIIICAALLAFIVLYNLTNINVSERMREIATLKVLGFTDREVNSYIFRENYILTAVGGLFGLGAGIYLHRFIMDAIEQETIMFGYHLETYSFFVVFAMTMLFSIIVSFVMRKKLKNINMVESLKSVE